MDTPSKLTLTYKGFDHLLWFSFVWLNPITAHEFPNNKTIDNINNELDLPKNRAVTVLQVYLKWCYMLLPLLLALCTNIILLQIYLLPLLLASIILLASTVYDKKLHLIFCKHSSYIKKDKFKYSTNKLMIQTKGMNS
jgi:hypothetical protein